MAENSSNLRKLIKTSFYMTMMINDGPLEYIGEMINLRRWPGLVLMGCFKVVGSNPSTEFWMDIFNMNLL